MIIDKEVPKIQIRICLECWMPYGWKPHDSGRKPSYCKKCQYEVGARKQRAAMNVHPKTCLVCGKDFLARRLAGKYCSKKCQYQFLSKKSGRMKVSCGTCGKILNRYPHDARKNAYCNYECMAKGKTLSAPRTNKWANVRQWFSRFNRMSRCEVCSYNEIPEILVIHHKNRDRSNNSLDNLAVLCPMCHAIEHLKDRKRAKA